MVAKVFIYFLKAIRALVAVALLALWAIELSKEEFVYAMMDMFKLEANAKNAITLGSNKFLLFYVIARLAMELLTKIALLVLQQRKEKQMAINVLAF